MDPHDSAKKLKRPADEPLEPALQAHLRALGLSSVEEYVAWCVRHGFSRRTAKHWRLRLKERTFASRAAADARLARKKQEVRRPENAIQAIFRGELTEEQVTEAAPEDGLPGVRVLKVLPPHPTAPSSTC